MPIVPNGWTKYEIYVLEKFKEIKSDIDEMKEAIQTHYMRMGERDRVIDERIVAIDKRATDLEARMTLRAGLTGAATAALFAIAAAVWRMIK